MIKVEDWVTIRNLKERGYSIKRIARELGLSKNTVRRALRGESPPKYSRPQRINPKLEPLHEAISCMLSKGFIGTRIFKELVRIGYQGSRSALYRYLSNVKFEEKAKEKVSERFETLPGEQGQFDWSSYRVVISNNLTRVIIFCLILCYSRRKHYFASLDETQRSCFEALEDSFWHFKGVPREILIDNPRAFVLDPRTQSFRWNPHFAEFCGHYRTLPRRCRIRRARTKGKVEKPFQYLEEHFIKGGSFRDFDDFVEKLKEFESTELDTMLHSTTQMSPIERFQEEVPYLIKLPDSRFIGTRHEWRKVSWDCLISFNGSRYSVPYCYAGKEVWVRTSRGLKLEIYNQKSELIAEHRISDKKGLMVIDKNHYEGLKKKSPSTMIMLRERFIEMFPDDIAFLEGLIAQYKLQPRHHLKAIMEMSSIYPVEELRKAFSIAREYNTYSSSFIKGIIAQSELQDETYTVTGVMIPHISIKRDLAVYEKMIGGSHGGC